ncbi:type II toxin-antitoxin system VapC family toxin [Glaciimonas immobilis]|uniref:tRNA(fMet)-specific endonuclease VapC n=1 Tax=Glaciimonas immobilis TaxID=728004 RepID=A0A840RQ97_9BURK|nr:type II toxin-antitoxin system VapC family toxin [Glaciimonas immobilis]MBB5200577.1 tRNA(fMet)-specific endonuclease VapC [Glaciimonas immobilis]
MLDTNTVSRLIKSHPVVARNTLKVPMASLCISAITESELLFGLSRRPEAKRLHVAVREFLRRVDVMSWDSAVAKHYGILRARMEGHGKILASLDMLIATHALSTGAILVTNERAFDLVPDLQREDWTS